MDIRIFRGGLTAACLLVVAACTGSPSSGNNAAGGSGGKHTMIKAGDDAGTQAITAFVSARPGDVIEFGCGFFDIDSTLLLSHVEDITVKGCGRDKTVLSFKNNNAPEGILIDSANGIRISDLTVADTDGNGFELRTADHVTLTNVRAFWSSNGGRTSPEAISAADADAEGSFASKLHVACTAPPIRNPNVPENAILGGTTSPDYTPSDRAGRYGIYPVKSRNVLVEKSESVGASDAGIYVGQSSNIIIRDSRAVYNVFGFEIENVQVGMYENNLAECNTGGFLVYDLDKLTQYGSRTIVRGNVARNNNTYNFTEGGFVANVPPGSGMITLSYDRIDIYDNVFEDNNTGGILHVSYELFPEGFGRPGDRKIDFYSEGVRIFDNTFINNGNNLPVPTSDDLQSADLARALPAIMGLKNQFGGDQYRGAHILWDGLMDELDSDCEYPRMDNANNDPVPEDEYLTGKPDYRTGGAGYRGESAPEPDCRYNGYKFDGQGNRKTPDWWFSCIEDNNSFSSDSLRYANFHGLKGLNGVIDAFIQSDSVTSAMENQDPEGFVAAVTNLLGTILNPGNVTDLQDFPSDFDMSVNDCKTRFGSTLDQLPDVVIPAFEPTGEFDDGAQGDANELCNAAVADGQVNFAATTVACPLLQQYNLFADSEDPRSAPNSGGVPFVLNTKLFSDYSVKYRVAFIPPGKKAAYNDSSSGNAPNAGIIYPEGTILAKTFAFLNGANEEVIETRLLIKRSQANGTPVWSGLPYIWTTDEGTGERIAVLQKIGGSASVAWDYIDADSGTHYTGSTGNYAIPTAGQCLSCHSNQDQEGGTAPIGPKVRNMNRLYKSESSIVTAQSTHEIAGQNQLKYLCDTGRMSGCPSFSIDPSGYANVERIPKYNVPGDSGNAAGSDEDTEARARAWLETNCAHCHNPSGFAANTGFYVDVFRDVDSSHGICKGVTAAGAEGTNGRTKDIVPTKANESVLDFRISQAAEGRPAARMPPIARSRTDAAAHSLIADWINNVIDGSYDDAGCESD